MGKPSCVGIVVWDGVDPLDIAGPDAVFSAAGDGEAFDVVTIAATREPVTTQGGLGIEPRYGFDDSPPLAVLVVPGGDTGAADAGLLDFIRTRAATTHIVLSVRSGARLLADAGVPDGSGIVTSPDGVTAGVDASLHVVSRLLGEAAAQRTAQRIEHGPAVRA